MQRLVLDNGLTVLYKKIPSRAISIQAMVKIGSNQEKDGQRGVAHMVEHLVFEGTAKLDSGNEVARMIENVGGEFNAYTTNHRTCYYVKVLKKHSKRAFKVLSDIMQNSVFREKDFVREREIVYKEIDMYLDDPKSFQWLELEKMLFKKNNCRFPSSGLRADLAKMRRDDVYKFYRDFYSPDNVVIAITGEISNWRDLVEDYFSSWEISKKVIRTKVKEPSLKKNLKKSFKKQFESNYLMFGYHAASRGHKDSYVFDVIQAILGKGQSGKLFQALRGKEGLVYDVAAEYGCDIDFGYFVIYASFSKKHSDKVKKIIFEQIELLSKVSETDLQDAKTYIEGDYLLDIEDVQKYGDQMLYWHDIGDVDFLKKYIANVRSVSLADIKRVVKKYFDKCAVVELEGKK